MFTTLENWGQLKIVSVDDNTDQNDSSSHSGNDNNNNNNNVNSSNDKKFNEDLTRNNRDSKSNKCMFVQLLSLPKFRDRGNVVHVSKPIVNIPISAVASATATTKNDLTLNLKSKTFVTRHKNCDF